MSAQAITALRRRAYVLDAEAAQMRRNGASETPEPDSRPLQLVSFLAAEYRKLADEMERGDG